MSKLLKNQKGISLIKLVIIIAIIIVAIIFIVKMSQPRDGLGTPEEEAEKLRQTQENYDKTLEETRDAQDKYYNSMSTLKELEENN